MVKLNSVFSIPSVTIEFQVSRASIELKTEARTKEK